MKKLALLSIAILLLIVASLSLLNNTDQETRELPLPYDTQIVSGEDEDHHRKKEQWIEQMHRTAPGVNWRQMDQQYRQQHQEANRENTELPIYGRWRELGSNNQAGRTVFTHYDPESGELLVASDGGQIWTGDLGEENWESINDHYKIPAIRNIRRIEGEAYSRLLVHSAAWNVTGIMYSDDEGETWTLAEGLESITSWGFIKRMVVQDSLGDKTIFCLSQEWDYNGWKAVSRLYKSVDHGESFDLMHSIDHGVNTVDIYTSLSHGSPLVMLDENDFYFFDGDNMYPMGSLPIQETGTTLLTGMDGPAELRYYAMVNYNNASHFFSYTLQNGWEEKGSVSQGPFMQNSFMASQLHTDVLYFGGIEAFVSQNGGDNWTLVNTWGQYYGSPEDKLHADIPCFNSFVVGQNEEILFVNTDGGTYVSYDQMENVQNLSLNNLNISQYYDTYTCRFDPSYTHAGAQDQGYQRSNEGMQEGAINYDQIISGDYASMVSGDEGASIWMVYPGFAMYGPNINNTDQLIFEDFVGSNYQWLPKLMDDPEDPENVFLAGGHMSSGAHIMLLDRTGYGITTTELPFDFSNGTNANISAMAYSKANTDHRFVLTSEQDFFRSTDGGDTWTMTNGFEGPGSHYFYGASIAPSANQTDLVYVGGSGYSSPGVFRSTDGGQSFEAFAEGLPSTMVFRIVLNTNDSLLFAATEVGAFVCKTWEAQWYALADEVIPDQAFWSVDFIDTLQLARFATYGRGVWDFELQPEVEADFVADLTYIYTNESINFMDLSSYQPQSWEWTFVGATPATSTDQHPNNIVYPTAGAYDVQLIVSNSYSSDTLLMEDYISVGTVSIDDESAQSAKLYPNPASDYVWLETTHNLDQLLLISASGKIIRTLNTAALEAEKVKIDLNGLASGQYFVKTISGQKARVYTLLKK